MSARPKESKSTRVQGLKGSISTKGKRIDGEILEQVTALPLPQSKGLSRHLHKAIVYILCAIALISPSWISSYLDFANLVEAPLSYDPTTLPRMCFLLISGAALVVLSQLKRYFDKKELLEQTELSQLSKRLNKPLNWRTLLDAQKLPILLFTLLFIWMCISSLINNSILESFMGSYTRYNGLLPHLLYLSLLISLSQIELKAQDLPILIRSLLLGSIPVSIVGILQGLGLDIFGWAASFDNRAGSSFGNPNMLGTYLIVVYLFSWSCLRLKLSRSFSFDHYLTISSLVLLLVLAFFSYNRSPWLAILVCTLFLEACFKWAKPPLCIVKLKELQQERKNVQAQRQAQKTQKTVHARTQGGAHRATRPGFSLGSRTAASYKIAVALALAATLIILLSLDYHLRQDESLISRLATIVSPYYWSHSSRHAIWSVALQSLSQRPLTGFGIDSFTSVFSSNYSQDLAIIYQNPKIIIDSPHNIFLQHALGGGLIQLAFYLAFLASILRLCIKRKTWILLSCLLGIILQLCAIPDTGISEAYFYLICGLCLAQGPSSKQAQEESQRAAQEAQHMINTAAPDNEDASRQHSALLLRYKSRYAHRLKLQSLVRGVASLIVASLFVHVSVQLSQADYAYSQARTHSERPSIESYLIACKKAPYILDYRWRCIEEAAISEHYDLSYRSSFVPNLSKQALKDFPNKNLCLAAYAHSCLRLYERGGKTELLDLADQLSKELIEKAPNYPYYNYIRALYYELVGDKEQAIRYAQLSYAQAVGHNKDASVLLDSLGAPYVNE